MTDSNTELRLAEEFVQHTDCHVFLTGRAGTGKTTFLQSIRDLGLKRLVVTAPTGVAAINAGGVTLHSFFQLPFGPYIPGSNPVDGPHRIRREKKNIIRGLDLLVIDEISMVRSDLLDSVDAVLRRHRRSDRPFGGVQLLMIGDLHQLPPVVKKDEWPLLQPHYDTPYFFSSTALRRTELVTIELQHIYRQSDPQFIELLNRVRDGRLDAEALDRLNSRYTPGFSPADDDQGYITLCTHNRSADAINRARLEKLGGSTRRFDAELQGEFPAQAFPTSAELKLKPGAQVMFIRNDTSGDKRFFNGKIGRITAMTGSTVTVRCPEDASAIEVEKSTWENIEYAIDPQTAEITQKVIGTFSQYPLKLAWAITIHKSQGLTFDKAIIDAGASFAHGQVYVALSRCRTLEGIVLGSQLSQSALRCDATIRRFGNEADNNAPTAERLAAAKNRFQQRLLLECFDFRRLRRLLGRLTAQVQRHAAVIRVTGVVDMAETRRAAEEQIFGVGDKFQRQLQGMFGKDAPPAEDPAIARRIAKAAEYFQERFAAVLSAGLADFAVETDNKEIRKNIRAVLKSVKEEATVKLAGILSGRDGFSPERYLQALSVAAVASEPAKPKPPAVTYTEADVGHPELFQALREWRTQKAAAEGIPHYRVLHQKTLVQIAVRLPDSMKALKETKGIGPRLAERYGEELVAMVNDYRRRHGITEVSMPEPSSPPPPPKPKPKPEKKEDTKQISRDLFLGGMTLTEIAAERNLALSTIEGHLAHYVANGELDIDRMVPAEKRRAIEEKAAAVKGTNFKALKAALGDGFSYGEIKLVLAHGQQRRRG